jgi:pilus assembly protein CpaF
MKARAGRDGLLDRVRMRLAAEPDGLDELDLGLLARQESALVVDSGALDELSGQLSAELSGAGPLEVLLELPGMTDVLVNSCDRVFIDRGRGLELTTVRFPNDAAVRGLAARLAAQAGRRLDDAMPYVDASLPDGTRLHAILPPLVMHPVLSLRVLRRQRRSLSDLVSSGMLSADVAAVLRAVVEARLTLLISGGTGAGKTTLLGAMLAEVSRDERIITVEDAAELAVDHPHVVALLARSANLERAGAVDLRELVRQSLRMRADRIVVGEFRGAEILELLAALNTGHAGGAATVHANSVGDIPARLVALAALGGMSDQVLAAQAASALDVLVHLERRRDGTRRLVEIALWPRGGDGVVTPTLIWTSYEGLGVAANELAARLTRAGVEAPALLRDAVTSQPGAP